MGHGNASTTPRGKPAGKDVQNQGEWDDSDVSSEDEETIAEGLVAVRVVVGGKLFATSLQALRAGACQAQANGNESEVLNDMFETATRSPGATLVLERDPTAYPFVMMYLNLGKVSGVTCVAQLVKEAKFLGLDELEQLATKGNFYSWRSGSAVVDHIIDHMSDDPPSNKARRPSSSDGGHHSPERQISPRRTPSDAMARRMSSGASNSSSMTSMRQVSPQRSPNEAIVRLSSGSNLPPPGAALRQVSPTRPVPAGGRQVSPTTRQISPRRPSIEVLPRRASSSAGSTGSMRQSSPLRSPMASALTSHVGSAPVAGFLGSVMERRSSTERAGGPLLAHRSASPDRNGGGPMGQRSASPGARSGAPLMAHGGSFDMGRDGQPLAPPTGQRSASPGARSGAPLMAHGGSFDMGRGAPGSAAEDVVFAAFGVGEVCEGCSRGYDEHHDAGKEDELGGGVLIGGGVLTGLFYLRSGG
eukprot:CAMPEP_0173391448 /NCGR_PEP_ID=MMETSP1356-20130122/18388_1 /TAXON_ID=77927 ORGANISM="Hemiselmis virescens, Strain PCC157" /NCGR_SAMPLE_ID=MMETSP1356 /ASSEMBLY_ACC=CAM_ASM_000847 /LENGTH=472 /DNA_ID=CAMNT_0014349081 /DNA_START=50 /DNA_END=1467 /DNA_ORIENTATION=-